MVFSALSSDFDLPKTGPLNVSFVISEHIPASKVLATVYFSADGFRQLRSDGRISVNGLPLQGKPKMKAGVLGSFQTGYYYRDSIPVASRYELVFKRAADQPELGYVISPRRFQPQVPATFSRNRDLRIPFAGPVLAKNEEPYMVVDSPDGVTPVWMVHLHGRVEGNEYIIPASLMAKVRLGRARLKIGVQSNQGPTGSQDEIYYAITQDTIVEITD